MPQPTGRDLYIDTLLSNASIGYMNKPSAYIADQVFPVILAPKQSGKIAHYTKDDWFRDEAEMRAPLTKSAGGGFKMETPITYFCDEWAYHKDYSDEDYANADEVFDIERDCVEFVVDKLRMSRERRFSSAFFATSVWTTDLTGVTVTPHNSSYFKCWDESGSHPITDINNGKLTVRSLIGRLPNILVVSERAHMTLKEHADLKDIFKYTQAGVVTEQLLAKALEVDKYVVARAVYASNKEGDTVSMAYALDQYSALLVYAEPRPSIRRPSGGYTIRWNRPKNKGMDGERLESTIRRFTLEEEGGTRIDGSVYEDLKLTAADAGVFFSNAIANGRSLS